MEGSPAAAERFLERAEKENAVERVEQVAKDPLDPEVAKLARLWLQAQEPSAIIARAEQRAKIEAAAPAEQLQFQSPGGVYKLLSRHIPLSVLAETFFDIAAESLSAEGGPLLRDRFIARIGVGRGSTQVAALIEAALYARDSRPDEVEKLRRRDHAEELLAAGREQDYMEAQRQDGMADARSLGEAWGILVDGLGGADSPAMSKLLLYVESIRQSTSVSSTNSFDNPEHYVWTCDRSFKLGADSTLSRLGGIK